MSKDKDTKDRTQSNEIRILPPKALTLDSPIQLAGSIDAMEHYSSTFNDPHLRGIFTPNPGSGSQQASSYISAQLERLQIAANNLAINQFYQNEISSIEGATTASSSYGAPASYNEWLERLSNERDNQNVTISGSDSISTIGSTISTPFSSTNSLPDMDGV